MASPYLWFKVWLDILDDPKVHALPDSDFRTFINLLGFAKESDLAGKIPFEDGTIAYRLRKKKDHISRSIDRLSTLEEPMVLRLPEGGLFIPKFKKRQDSDSKDRTSRWREKKRHGDASGDRHDDRHDDAQRFRSREDKDKDLVGDRHGDARGAPPSGVSEPPPSGAPKRKPDSQCIVEGCTKRRIINKRCREHFTEQDEIQIGVPGVSDIGAIE